MMSMGLMQAPEEIQETGPECPVLFLDVFDKYRELKFMQREEADRVTLIPRQSITWQDIKNYKDITGQAISYLESELLMGLDAIFEGRDHD